MNKADKYLITLSYTYYIQTKNLYLYSVFYYQLYCLFLADFHNQKRFFLKVGPLPPSILDPTKESVGILFV